MRAYLLLLEAEHCRDMDEWLGIFIDVLELKSAYDEVKNNPSPDWEKFLTPAIYEFPLNTLIKDIVFDERIQAISLDRLNDLVKEEIRNIGGKRIDKHIGALETLAK